MFKQLWLAAIAALTVAPLAALAHAKLLSTSPAAGSQLGAAPKALTLKFDEAVQLAVLKVSSEGKDVPLTLDRAAAASPQVTIALPPLAVGTYRVQWSALTADDGHVVKGSFSFSITGGN